MGALTVPRASKHQSLYAAMTLIVLALPGLAAGAGATEPSAHRRTPVVDAIQRVQPCVVSLSSEKRAASNSRWPFTPEENQRPRVSGMGTGVIVDERGYILTNQHVVDRVDGLEVQLADGSRYPGRIIQQDNQLDIALVKIDAGRPLTAIRMGTSADLMVGESVITIGNAFGYENTTSVGIISALNRNVTLSDDQVYRNLIQTDACINPGNSGGPLINIDGELIGINVAVRAGAQGIGFALPIDDVKRVAVEMMSTRRLASTWHGVVAAEAFGGPERMVVVASVQPGSPAEAAGVKPGDRLVRAGALTLSNPLDLERALLDVRAGQKADLIVKRGGQDQTLTVEMKPAGVGAAGGAVIAASTAVESNDQIWQALGMRLVPVSREYVAAVSAEFRGGLFVQSVQPGSAAEKASIQRGDILVGMNVGNRNWETIRTDNLAYIIAQAETSQTARLQYYVVRRNSFVEGSLSLLPTAATAASTRR
jgi:serine protease Do